MKIIVKKRFSIKENGKLKFLEKNEKNPIEIKDSLGEKAIAAGYATKTDTESKSINN